MSSNTFEIIHLRDPAIDWERVPRDVYMRHWESRDPRVLAPYIFPGKQPTSFQLREIPHDLAENWVLLANDPASGGATALTFRRAFCASLVLVTNKTRADGITLPTWEPPVYREGAMAGCMLDEACAEFTAAQRIDVGAVAYQRMGFPLGTKPTFRQPLMFLDLLGPLTPLSAEPTPQSQAQPSSTPSGDAAAA